MEARTISPREFASVVGVSESSVKRWVDAGRIPVNRTAGGHRRIPVTDALRFVRMQGMRLIDPDRLGLRDLSAVTSLDGDDLTGSHLTESVIRGDDSVVRGLLLQSYVSGTSPEDIFDGPVAEAMAYFGTLYHHDTMGITYEHRFTALCVEAMNQMRFMMDNPPEGAPRALGGSPEEDPYILPNLMASIVCGEAGYEDINLGPNLPGSALLRAADRYKPRLVWMALNAPLDDAGARREADTMAGLLDRGCAVVLGGREAGEHRTVWPAKTFVVSTMNELRTVAEGLWR